MSHQTNLNQRYQNILKATIKHYIATAEPVGSKTLAEEYNLKVSSATIRNVMGRLEEAGFLYQPHASAGRIPSDSGYRLYVDRLISPDTISGKQLEWSLSRQLKKERWSFEALLQRATQILATLSGYIALITLPQNPSNILRHLQLVHLSSGQIMLIIVTDAYQTQSVLMELSPFTSEREGLDEEVIEGELQILSNFLNSKLKGRSLAEIAALDGTELGREFERYADFLQVLARELRRFSQPSAAPIMVRGVAEVLRQPEFSQLQQVQTLLHLLEEEQDQLWPLIFTVSHFEHCAQRVTIRIGSENPLEPMRTCTLIAANYYQDDIPVGSVGVIGPTRMLYENAIALVETTADYLSDALS
ncbi:heat-inducible transcriptional repressor HrcA [Pleurocapsales cyanobacterium LEGE 06147]|nr:heat-inducible transcriptional repressor HrcA [Pleurocapsales cyanobacterium LEGE 06147]